MGEILITDRVRTGRSALLWRDSDEVWRKTEGVPTMPLRQAEQPGRGQGLEWPPLVRHDLHGWMPHRALRLSLMTRIRLALARWIAPT